MISIKEMERPGNPNILVIGVGGGGNNAVNRMISSGVSRVEFAAVNTDRLVLEKSKAEQRIRLGEKLLKGYGAGADPDLGESAAMESEEEIRTLIEGRDMVIVTCGEGGGTGTGATPIIARIAKEAGILTLGVVTLPFTFEGNARMNVARQGIDKLKEWVDTLLVIPNDKLLGLSDKPLLLDTAFELADSVLKNTIECVSNIVYNDGTINIDFNDLKTTFTNKGTGHLGVGIANTDGSVLDAVKQAVNSPLLETSIEGAEVLLVNTCGRVDIRSVHEAVGYLNELTGPDTRVIWGTVEDQSAPEDRIMVTLVATGMNQKPKTKAVSVAKPLPVARLEHPVNMPPRTPGTGNGMELKIPDFLKAYSRGKE